jgi:hypothetical protein
MKRMGLLLLLAPSLLAGTGCSAANHDVDAVVSGVEQRYSTSPQHVPMMGLISFCARMYTRGGVKEMHIAEFEHLQHADPVELFSLVQSRLGGEWKPIVKEQSRAKGNDEAGLSAVFARPSGRSMQLLVADYENGELELVRMGIDGATLSRWINEHEHNRRSPPNGTVSGE